MSINIPANAETLFENQLYLSKKLIKYGYWGGIKSHELSAWGNNFVSPEEKFIATGILSSLIYRNYAAMDAFYAQIIQVKLPTILENLGIYTISCIEDWEEKLTSQKARALPFRFSAVEGVDDKPGKSGSTIYRAIRKQYFSADLGINVTKLSKTPEHIKAIIFIDDTIGTGTQFGNFVDKYNLNDLGVKVIYIPLLGFESSVNLIGSKYSNITVSPIELICDKAGLFHPSNEFFSIYAEYCPIEYKSYYLEMCNNRNIKADFKLGCGELELTYCFHESTPNNNLAVLWYNDKNWHQLIKR